MGIWNEIFGMEWKWNGRKLPVWNMGKIVLPFSTIPSLITVVCHFLHALRATIRSLHCYNFTWLQPFLFCFSSSDNLHFASSATQQWMSNDEFSAKGFCQPSNPPMHPIDIIINYVKQIFIGHQCSCRQIKMTPSQAERHCSFKILWDMPRVRNTSTKHATHCHALA